MKYTTFVRDVLGVKLTPKQLELCRVLFDGETRAPKDLFGSSTIDASKEARKVAVIRKGIRAGGTMLSAYRLLHLVFNVDLTGLVMRPGEKLEANIVGPDVKRASYSLDYIRNAVLTTRVKSQVVRVNETSIALRRPDGRQVNIEIKAAARAGVALRGAWHICVHMTEAAFFRDENSVVNDQAIFDAIYGRVVPGGQIILESSPWSESGLLYSLDRENFGLPRQAVVAHAPTLAMWPDDQERRGLYLQAMQNNPVNARREWDAEYMAAGTGQFFDGSMLDACMREAPVGVAPVFAGADFGFVHDASALVCCKMIGGVVVVTRAEERQPQQGRPLQPSVVASEFGEILHAEGCTQVHGDAHYFHAIAEYLAPWRVGYAPGGDKERTHQRVKDLVHAGRLVIDVNIPARNRLKLVQQLKEIVAKPTPGGKLTLSSPRKANGGHGDIASAMVLAVSACAQRAEVSKLGDGRIAYFPVRRPGGGLTDAGVPTERDSANVIKFINGRSGGKTWP